MRSAGWSGGSWFLLASACAAEDYVDDPGDDAWLDGKADGASAVNMAHEPRRRPRRQDRGRDDRARDGRQRRARGRRPRRSRRVTDGRGNRRFTVVDGKLLVSNVRGALVVEYAFEQHTNADGLLPGGSTVIWPYFCGNLFPCHSQPADGTTFTLDARRRALRQDGDVSRRRSTPRRRRTCSRGRSARTRRSTLGTTTAGTKVATYCLPGGETAATTGTKHLVAAFDWYEKTLGPYSFGTRGRVGLGRVGRRHVRRHGAPSVSGTSRRTR